MRGNSNRKNENKPNLRLSNIILHVFIKYILLLHTNDVLSSNLPRIIIAVVPPAALFSYLVAIVLGEEVKSNVAGCRRRCEVKKDCGRKYGLSYGVNQNVNWKPVHTSLCIWVVAAIHILQLLNSFVFYRCRVYILDSDDDERSMSVP